MPGANADEDEDEDEDEEEESDEKADEDATDDHDDGEDGATEDDAATALSVDLPGGKGTGQRTAKRSSRETRTGKPIGMTSRKKPRN